MRNNTNVGKNFIIDAYYYYLFRQQFIIILEYNEKVL